MVTDPIRTYRDALQRFHQATAHVERVVRIVRQGARALEDWQHASVSSMPSDWRTPTRPDETIDALQWPTAQQIADVLMIWHAARHEARTAWQKVPPADRAGLPEPPAYQSLI